MNPILNEIGAVFIPVKNIENARNWYCDLLGIPAHGDIVAGHLYVVPMKGNRLVLDSKIYSEHNLYKTPPLHFNTKDIEVAFSFMKEKRIELITDIENGHWFNFKDLDGNVLMICE
ncbi:VOC family protein [Pseudalkalibacillus sp. NRS-1564]|uniref:VOC family protein n=1 Tax=Pseudalkalibacillus sp. NRS-1564 TaxID=3233900 RepID=UPI003D28ECB0